MGCVAPPLLWPVRAARVYVSNACSRDWPRRDSRLGSGIECCVRQWAAIECWAGAGLGPGTYTDTATDHDTHDGIHTLMASRGAVTTELQNCWTRVVILGNPI